MGSFHIYPPLGPAGCWLPLRPRRGRPSRRGRDLRRPGPLEPRGRVHKLPRGPGPLLDPDTEPISVLHQQHKLI